MKLAAAVGLFVLLSSGCCEAADLSPAQWPPELRSELEQRDFFGAPAYPATIQGKSELITATASPVAIHAGMEALRRGGTAADAAATVALTQITTNFGAVVSFAGVSELLYFDAKTGKVYALQGEWASYAHETDPASIPATNLSVLTGHPPPEGAGVGDLGRQTLVPGFMAALEAMHTRFGRLPFADLFQPAIWYAENGVVVSPSSAGSFRQRQQQLWRAPAGRRFASMPNGALPRTGDLLRQPELAVTLRAVAAEGARYMYTGDWARAFVAAVRADGGKADLEDLARYKPVWSEPPSVEFQGANVFGPNEDPSGSCPTLEALNLLSAQHVETMGPYWRDPKAFKAYADALAFAQYAHYAPQVAALEHARGFTSDCASRVKPSYAAAFAPGLGGQGQGQTEPSPPSVRPASHTYAVIVVDRWGNVAALVHSINTLIWGDTGIVVGGIPIADAAAINAENLMKLKPGERVPSAMSPVIALKDGKPILVVASVGSSLIAETTRLVGGALASREDLKSLTAAPPLLLNWDPPKGAPLWDWPQVVPGGAYDTAMIQALAAEGVKVREEPRQRVQAIRGTAVLALLDQGAPRAVEVPNIIDFAESDLPVQVETPKQIALLPRDLERYVGEYRVSPTIVASITRQGDRLFAQATQWPRTELFADAKDHFFNKAVDVQLTFHLGPTGPASEVIVRRDGVDAKAPRIVPST